MNHAFPTDTVPSDRANSPDMPTCSMNSAKTTRSVLLTQCVSEIRELAASASVDLSPEHLRSGYALFIYDCAQNQDPKKSTVAIKPVLAEAKSELAKVKLQPNAKSTLLIRNISSRLRFNDGLDSKPKSSPQSAVLDYIRKTNNPTAVAFVLTELVFREANGNLDRLPKLSDWIASVNIDPIDSTPNCYSESAIAEKTQTIDTPAEVRPVATTTNTFRRQTTIPPTGTNSRLQEDSIGTELISLRETIKRESRKRGLLATETRLPPASSRSFRKQNMIPVERTASQFNLDPKEISQVLLNLLSDYSFDQPTPHPKGHHLLKAFILLSEGKDPQATLHNESSEFSRRKKQIIRSLKSAGLDGTKEQLIREINPRELTERGQAVHTAAKLLITKEAKAVLFSSLDTFESAVSLAAIERCRSNPIELAEELEVPKNKLASYLSTVASQDFLERLKRVLTEE